MSRAEQAEKLRAAVIGMAIRYGDAARTYAYAAGERMHADERARLLRAEKRTFVALQRLTRALANLAGSTW